VEAVWIVSELWGVVYVEYRQSGKISNSVINTREINAGRITCNTKLSDFSFALISANAEH
jgi:hypothetical protein